MSVEPETLAEVPGLVDWLTGDDALRDAFLSALREKGYMVSAPAPAPASKEETAASPGAVLERARGGAAEAHVRALLDQGHEVYTAKAGKDYNLNIVGIRDTSPTLDAYGCKLAVFWEKPNGEWVLKEWPITTYPGSYYLIDRLLSSAGCAILAEGQYKGIYKIDLHRGKYSALCQRLGNVACYRDKNRNRKFDLDRGSITRGQYGINIHAPITLTDGVKKYVDELVGQSSAGCQVFQSVADFREFMEIIRTGASIWSNVFTYTLIRDADLKRVESPTAPSTVVSVPTLSTDGVNLVKTFEGCLKPVGGGEFEAYPDPAHGWTVPTIGWGSIHYENGAPVKRGDRISQRRADELLAYELGEKVKGVNRLVKVPINEDQLGALVSFAYNLGLGNLEKSTLLKELNQRHYDAARDEFPKWNKAAGRVMRGLTRRRLSEQRLFDSIRPYIVTLEELDA